MKQSVKEVIKYGIVGVVGLAVEWITFILLRDYLHVNAVVSQFVSCFCGIVNNFFLNSYFTFKATDRLWMRAISFFSIAGVGLFLGLFIFVGLIKLINMWVVDTEILVLSKEYVENIAKLGTTVIVACLQFVFNKYITFKKKVVDN